MAEPELTPLTTETTKGPILIAVDDSFYAEEAFRFYLNCLRNKDDRVVVLHCSEPPIITAQYAINMTPDLWDELLAKDKARVRLLEEKFAGLMRDAGVSGKVKATFHGRPGETICDEAKAEEASMIVMGTRGMGTVRRTIMGSVSDYVIHHAHAPVCICRH